MIEGLSKLLNTMNLIETKGASTRLMSACLEHTEQLVGLARKEKEQNKALLAKVENLERRVKELETEVSTEKEENK